MTQEFYFKPSRKVTVNEAISQWETWMISVGRSPSTVDNCVLYASSWAGDMGLRGISPSAATEVQIGTWINNASDYRKASSRQCALSSLRSFFRFCAAKGYTTGNPADLVEVNYRILSQAKKEKKPRTTFTEEEVNKLLAQPDQFWRAASAISRWTGLRMSDVACLEWSQISPNRIVVWTRKVSKRIEIPIYHPKLVSIIESIPRVDEQYVFPVQRAMAIVPRQRALLSWRFTELCRSLGITGKSFHSLRHSFAQERYERGQPIEGISSALAHAGTAVTRIYTGQR